MLLGVPPAPHWWCSTAAWRARWTGKVRGWGVVIWAAQDGAEPQALLKIHLCILIMFSTESQHRLLLVDFNLDYAIFIYFANLIRGVLWLRLAIRAVAFIYTTTINRYGGQVYRQNVILLTSPYFLTFSDSLLLYSVRPRPSSRLVTSNQRIRYVSYCTNTRPNWWVIFVFVRALLASASLPITSSAYIIITVASIA